jgi:hypothetical protein
MKPSKTFNILALAGLLLIGLSACQKNEPEEAQKGPAEKLGQQVDQAAAKAAVEINKFAEKAGGALEKAGEGMQDKARQAQGEEPQK